MKVLIGGKRTNATQAMRKTLSSQGCEVQESDGPAGYLEYLRDHPRPDVALIVQPNEAWMHALRTTIEHIYVIGLYPRLTGRRCLQAWNIGVDDIAMLSACPEEIAGRVAALSRIRSWVHTLGDNFTKPDFDPDEFDAVRGLDALMASSLDNMLGTDNMEVELLPTLPELAYGAEMPLLLVDELTELSVGIGITTAEVDPLMVLLFGEPEEPELVVDSVKELTNICGGALKRKVLEEGKTFSMGLPRETTQPEPPLLRCWAMSSDNIELIAWVRVRVQQPSRLCVENLSEGMVLSQPIYNNRGLMLLPGGAVLTERTIVRLERWLGGNALVEITRAA